MNWLGWLEKSTLGQWSFSTWHDAAFELGRKIDDRFFTQQQHNAITVPLHLHGDTNWINEWTNIGFCINCMQPNRVIENTLQSEVKSVKVNSYLFRIVGHLFQQHLLFVSTFFSESMLECNCMLLKPHLNDDACMRLHLADGPLTPRLFLTNEVDSNDWKSTIWWCFWVN